MSGFPVRPSRASFGPKPINRYPVRDPARYGDADIFDLLFWQCAGMGVCGAVALAILVSNGSTLALSASGEAWDPDGGIVPTVGRTSAGIYTLQYAASYTDKDGNTITTNLIGVDSKYQGLSSPNANRISAAVNADKRTIDIRIRNASDTLFDLASGDGILFTVY